MMSRAEPGAERNRTRLKAPATATPAPRLPLTSRDDELHQKGQDGQGRDHGAALPLMFR